MERTKRIFLVIIFIVMLLATSVGNMVYAAKVTDSGKKLYIGITEIRMNDEPNFGYAIGDPTTNGETGDSSKIWNLVEYMSEETDASLKVNGNKDIYCLKAGVGFSNVNKRATYDVFYNMKTERELMAAQNTVLASIVNGTVPYKASASAQEVQVSKYNSLLALLDMLYLIDDNEEIKTEYLNKVGIRLNEPWEVVLTRDDIAAVQQAAIWYFTNYEQGSTKFDKTANSATGWLNYTINGTTYNNLGTYMTEEEQNNPDKTPNNSSGSQRQQQAEMLYRYLIQTAKSKANEYQNITNADAPAALSTETLNYEEVGKNYIIGPIRMTANEGNPVDYDIDFVVKNGDKATTEYRLLNNDKKELLKDTKIKDLVGQDFYISMPVETTTRVKIETNIKYENKTLTAWTADGAIGESTQPILVPAVQQENVPGNLEVTPVPKKFDLALRKYITKIDGNNVEESRVPVIDTTTLQEGTTATYKHRKNPLVVKTNQKVIYNITIYNEGEKAGRATKIIDQLPKGIKFDRVVSGNFVLDTYNETTNNTLTLKRAEGNNENLSAYAGGNSLASETITIECTVTATATESGQIFTNLAWIAEEIDGEADITITNQLGKDRDSEPSTITTKTQDELVTVDNGYIGKDSNNGKDLNSPESYFEGQQDDDDFEKVALDPAEGSYDLELIKVDEADSTKKLQGAQFNVTFADGTTNTYTTDVNGLFKTDSITITKTGTEIITITEVSAPKGYVKKINTIKLTIQKQVVNGEIKATVVNMSNEDGSDVTAGATCNIEGNTIKVTVPNREKKFDLALRKYITQIDDTELKGAESRIPSIDRATLQSGTTATYKHKKDPVTVKTGSKIIYNLTVYNEGEKAGRATKIIDQLPKGIEFENVLTENFVKESYVESTNTLTLVRAEGDITNLGPYTGDTDPVSETIRIQCKVTAQATENRQVLTNLAWIAEEFDNEANRTITNVPGQDRDSEPSTITTKTQDELVTEDDGYIGNSSNTGKDLSDSKNYFEGQQDDDDFEKVVIEPKVIEPADLKLVKRIVEVNGKAVPERIKSVDVSKLNIEGSNSKTTAKYVLDKDPVEVRKGDIVTYTLRVYNEGKIDAYASEITEDIPEGLEYLESAENLTEAEKKAIEFNKQQLWGKEVKDESGRITQISTNYLSKDNEKSEGENLIKAFGENDGTKTEEDLDYREVQVKLKVVSENVSGTIIRNEAAVTQDTDANGAPVEDRDSKPEEWVKYEDDEDYDNIILKQFDLALRKFIVAVSKDETIEDSEYLRNDDGSYIREPVVDTSKLNTVDEDGKLITTAIYNHTKEPLLVFKNDIVVYMFRVYNEGDIDGYAAEIKDHLPPYLEFIDSEFNKECGWQVSEDGRTVTTTYLSSEDNIIKKAEKNDEGEYELDYVEVPIMCKVKDTVPTNQKVTNIVDITKYEDEKKEPVEDRDSQENNVKLPEDENLPGYKDDETGDYIPGQQDDDDFEKIIVKRFDLALRKWVTQAIVTDKNGTSVTETGHQPYDDPEGIVKVELHRKKLNEVTVKFRYSIRVINEGDIEGYAKEVTDYIPEGLKFVAEDNKGWTDEGNNVISTKLLENTLLKPGEYADVEVVLTWVNNENNMGVMTNTAEISEDYNEYDVPDDDSIPDNKKSGEDDIDDAPVMLSVSTGKAITYFGLGVTILVILASGLTLIKKYVL